jgi:hypothetical protein
MKLIYLGEELDSSVEHELNYDESKHPYGFDVFIDYESGLQQIRHNCTEIHHLFSKWKKETAFESNIHSTVGTRQISSLHSVRIEIAKEIADEHLSIIKR